ncbi:Nif3-like dinuclear metal center hexameric protein [Campylobacter sp. 2014D-0216]|uniref:Nif3-like dinuclear metal center hexameric protein n=1 Tax=Campylobacter sp. 2014D-0216 TaxID=1813595 RepID=UPI0018A362EB|nr:Nif3-like dinuclear metal center hexameric protein [Campylobacter sp. 2014D-0216]QOR00659.1 Nif3-like dinuclear metal center hexameric protein [Campylobacter sp. 2014D-0216]
MKIKEIYEYLDTISPFYTQSVWDNSGLLLGDFEQEVSKVYLALDVDIDLVENASENSLFIVHHPLIFKGLKHLSGVLYPQKLLTKMIQKNIALIAMHTNFDLSHLNAYFTSEILGFKIKEQNEFLIYCDVDFQFEELIQHIKKCLKLDHIRVVNAHQKQIKSLAICTGSGGDLISSVKADCFLSGDFKYHQALESYHNKLSLIDIGHYESELCFSEILAKDLQKFHLEVIISVSKNPFQYF